jgi:hypothetical protein
MKTTLLITLLAASMTVAIASGTVAQGGMGSGMMQGDMSSGMMGRMETREGVNRLGGPQGNMCPGMTMGSGMTCPCMEGGMHHGMMGSDTMHSGMGSGMMGGGMPGMMGSGMMRDGTGLLFGSRVVPTMNLSVDDVRDYLNSRLDRLHNKRLKLGDVKTDDATISADVVTGDNSLVQRLKINRRTGEIDYED